MMIGKTAKAFGRLILISVLVQSCMYDLQSKEIKKYGITEENIKKGKEILAAARIKQGFDKLKGHQVYSYHGSDTWKGMLGKMGKIWPDMKLDLDFKYEVGTFDGQVTYASGSEVGNLVGLQNWNYYEVNNADTLFRELDHRKSKRKVFGIAAFQYFNEMIDRLQSAPIISYAGQKEFRGIQYDLVFCTWEKPDAHDEHDQYVAWINQETGLMDFTEYTIRDSYLKPPGYKMLGGAIEFSDFKEIDGILIPHQQIVYAIKMRKKQSKFLHQLIITDFQFDAFDPSDLQVDKTIKKGGNHKN